MATIVTKPPILDETGQEIAAAIKTLQDTDNSLHIAGKAADANIVGKRFNRVEDKVRSLQTILQNIMGGALDKIIEVSSESDMVDHNRIYRYIGPTHKLRGLMKNHWYWYEDGQWNDGGLWQQIPLKWDILSVTATVDNKKAIFTQDENTYFAAAVIGKKAIFTNMDFKMGGDLNA